MADASAPSLEARLYRAALVLCPGEFRRDHGDEMLCDFDDARSEAAACGPKATWMLRLLVAADLGRTVVVQWMRTGLPVIGCVAAIVPLLLASAVASLARRFTPVLPTDPAGEEAAALMLLAIVAIMVIVTTIVLNVWMQRPRRHAGRR